MDKFQNISSKDVAKEAGVSQATVSYVLNNVPGIKIKPETRKAVLAAAKRLNYYPNLHAKSMRLKKSMSIALVSDKNVSSYGFIKTLEGIKDAIVPRNYSLTISFRKASENEYDEHVKYFISKRIDGIIFSHANPPGEHCQFLTERNIPFVIIHPNSQNDQFNLVKNDMDQAFFEAIQDLKAKGRKHIGFFGNGVGNYNDRRFVSFLKAMEHCAIPIDQPLLYKTPADDDEIEASIGQFYQDHHADIDAIICSTPGVGFHLLRFLARHRIPVPDKVSVIAIGTSKFSSLTYPALSAIESPLYQMGYSAAEMLFDLMDGNPTKNLVVLQWAYIPRESS